MDQKFFLEAGALTGALSVMLGAFGAHGLKKVADPSTLAIFETAVRYQFFHVFALIAVGLLIGKYDDTLIQLSGYFFILGMLLFSGSLYLLVFKNIKLWAGLDWIVFITPLGGLTLIIGWVLLFLGIKKS